MLENWKQIAADEAYGQLGLICVEPGTTVYVCDNGDMMETVCRSDEIDKWCYNGVSHDDWSELLMEGFGDTPEEAYANREYC